MTITKAVKYTRIGSIDMYPILKSVGKTRRGRRPNKLWRTLVNLEVGDGFVYPYTTSNSVHRLARQLGLKVEVNQVDAGYMVIRID